LLKPWLAARHHMQFHDWPLRCNELTMLTTLQVEQRRKT
jgi:hypothetical protein